MAVGHVHLQRVLSVLREAALLWRQSRKALDAFVLMTSFLNIKALFFHSGLKGLQNSASDKMWREQDGETRQIMKAGLYPRISLNPDEQSQKILIRRHISGEAVRRLLYFSSGDLKRNVITLVKEVNMQGLLYYS